MQIPHIPLSFGPGFLHQPRPGSRQQTNPDLQAKAPQARGPVAKTPIERALVRAAEAGALGEAVEALAAEGPLPRRGSLVDLRA